MWYIQNPYAKTSGTPIATTVNRVLRVECVDAELYIDKLFDTGSIVDWTRTGKVPRP